MRTASKHRHPDAGLFWSVPEDALAVFALDHSDPTWSQLDAWALKARGFSDIRIDVYPVTFVEQCALIRSRARECGLGGQVARLRRELEARRLGKLKRSA